MDSHVEYINEVKKTNNPIEKWGKDPREFLKTNNHMKRRCSFSFQRNVNWKHKITKCWGGYGAMRTHYTLLMGV